MPISRILRLSLPCALLIATGACGAPFKVTPACKTAYDACINHCAEACESNAALDGAERAAGDMVNTWDGHCGECVEQCKHLEERCGR